MLSVIIPAYNEETILPITLHTLDRHRFWQEMIIVDDGSNDRTAITKLPEGAHLIRHEHNYGKGRALQTGIANSKGDILLFLDADLGETAQYAHALVEPVISGEADLTIAKFPPAGRKGGFGLVKGLARYGIKRITGAEVSEPLSGQRCMRRQVAHSVMQYHYGFGIEVAFTLDVLRAGYTINEIEVPFAHRELGRTWRGFMHRGQECVEIMKTLWSKRKG
jgi:glycosyltransferase involved in cell wall biosynthesis